MPDVWQFFELASDFDNAASVEPDSPLARWFAAIDGRGPAGRQGGLARNGWPIELEQIALGRGSRAGRRKRRPVVCRADVAQRPLPAGRRAGRRKFASEGARTRLAEMRSQIATLEPQLAEPIPVGELRPGRWRSANDL